MNVLTNLRLGVRLGLAFALLGLAAAAIGLSGVSSMRSLERDTERVASVADAIAASSALGQDVAAHGQDVTRHLYIQDGDVEAQDATAKAIAGRKDRISANLATLARAARGTALEPRVEELTEAREAYVAAFQKVLATSRAETVRGAEDRGGSRGAFAATVEPNLDRLLKELDEVRSGLTAEAQARSEAAHATGAGGTRTIVLVSLAALLLAIAAAVLITRSVTVPLRAVADRLRSLTDNCSTDLRAALERFASGDLTQEVVPVTTHVKNPGRDEIGAIARAVNALRDNFVGSVDAYNASRGALSQMVGSVRVGHDALGRQPADGLDVRGGRAGRGRDRQRRR